MKIGDENPNLNPQPKDPIKEWLPYRWYSTVAGRTNVSTLRAKQLVKIGERVSPNPRMRKPNNG
jgi:hypothetical protein